MSQFIRIGKRKKRLLGELYDFPEGTMAIGRLDEHSEGLLLLTTDGKVSELVRGKGIEKEYYAQVDGLVDATAITALRSGVQIGFNGKRYTTQPCKVERLITPPNLVPREKKIRDDRHGPTSWLAITLTEGKFRQVRKMTAAVNLPTLRLIRVRIGKITLDDHPAGSVIEVAKLSV